MLSCLLPHQEPLHTDAPQLMTILYAGTTVFWRTPRPARWDVQRKVEPPPEDGRAPPQAKPRTSSGRSRRVTTFGS